MAGVHNMRITAEQCRAGRGFLGWTGADLARASGVSPRAISAFERRVTTPHDRTLRDIEEAFRDAGVEFFSDQSPDFSQGVRWRPSRGRQ